MTNKKKILIFGATGLIGSGVLDETLDDDRIEKVTVVVRSNIDKSHPKLDQIIHKDFTSYSSIQEKLSGYDACLWCLGISYSQAKDEAHYELITKTFAMEAANTLKKLNPNITFIFISGAGTNAKSKQKWARIKGETEISLGNIGFRDHYNVRPGIIRSVNGAKHSLLLYRITSVLNPVFNLFFPRYIITNRQVGEAMVLLAIKGSSKKTLENDDMKNLIKEHSGK